MFIPTLLWEDIERIAASQGVQQNFPGESVDYTERKMVSEQLKLEREFLVLGYLYR